MPKETDQSKFFKSKHSSESLKKLSKEGLSHYSARIASRVKNFYAFPMISSFETNTRRRNDEIKMMKELFSGKREIVHATFPNMLSTKFTKKPIISGVEFGATAVFLLFDCNEKTALQALEANQLHHHLLLAIRDPGGLQKVVNKGFYNKEETFKDTLKTISTLKHIDVFCDIERLNAPLPQNTKGCECLIL